LSILFFHLNFYFVYVFSFRLEYILPLLILGDGFFQYGVSLWTEYASKALGTIIS